MQFEVNGASVYAYTAGKALDTLLPAVLFIHGAELEHSCWSLQSRWFANHGYCTLAVDLPGHGRSGGSALTSIETLSAWLVELLDALGIARAALVGHSMGSLIALETAAAQPERVSALALLGHATPMPVSDVLLDAAKNDVRSAERMINLWSHSARGQIGGNTVPGLWLMGMSQRLMERARPGVLFTDLSACNDYRHGLERAAAVRCPTLILSGGADQMTPARAALAVAQAIVGSKRLVLPGSGHAMMAEQPDAVLDALIGLLGR